ncbi:uncharacterized protein BN796_00368 [Alistipes sp. CAG:831]|nr:uncharacterized protein BN796_00368 [Alistipes sp. CAG:831]
MDAIGGYFELELRRGEHYHKDAIRLNTARNCFEYILMARKYKKVYIPYYTCEVMLQPLKRQQVDYSFYSIDWNLEPTEIFKLKEGEAFLYTNYFGLKQDCVERLAKVYGSRLIIDNAHAFFAPRVSGIDTFYSPRKFFGVSDGGYLYTDCLLSEEFPQDESWNRMSHLLIRADKGAEYGYSAFRKHEDELDNVPIKRMSRLTEKILQNVDYEITKKKRRTNYKYFESLLKSNNKLTLSIDKEDVPMAYPYLTEEGASLREKFISKRIFVPSYWPNVLRDISSMQLEYQLSKNTINIPIDQRYEKLELLELYDVLLENK